MISSIGTSNIDYLMQSYRMLEERPIRDLESRRDSINNRISLFNTLKTKLRALESLANELTYSDSTSVFGSKTATVSDTDYLTVTASSSAVITSHTVFVSQLAKADKVVSNQYTLSDTSIYSTLGAGTFTFQVTVNGDSHQVSVTISADDDNETILNNIVTAVNNTTDIGITASVINDTGTTGRLVFTSEESGADYEMSLSDVSGSLLSTIGMNDSVAMSGTSGGYVYDSSELNAIVIVDGITIEQNSNVIENAVEGLTLSLKKTHSAGDSPVTVNVQADVETIKSKLEDFIEAYNDVLDFIQTNTSVNTTTYERSAFSGDFTITNIKLELRSLLSEPVTGLPSGDPTILAQVGITPDRNGKLQISDSDTLEEYLQENLDQVSALFNSSDGFATRLVDFLDTYTGGDGVIEQRKDVLQGHIKLINNRIDQMQNVVDRRIEYYRQQYAQLQAAYNMYAAQYSNMGNMLQNGFVY